MYFWYLFLAYFYLFANIADFLYTKLKFFLSYFMIVEVTKLPKSEIKLIIEVESEKMNAYQEKALIKLNRQLNIPGFRKGKVPYEVMLDKVGEQSMRAFIVDEAVPFAYAEAIIQKDIQVISKPKISILSFDPLKFEAVVAVMPEIILPDLHAIKVEDKDLRVTENDVEEILTSLQRQHAVFNEVERPIQSGDRIEVSYQGFDEEGKEIPSIKSKNHPVMVGDQMMVKGFEDNLMGLKKGEKKSFAIIFPNDYHYDKLKGKNVRFDIEIGMVEERILPPIDDVFVEKMTGKKETVLDFKKKIADDLARYRTENEKERKKNGFIEELVKKSQFEISDQLIEEESEYILDDYKQEVKKKGMEWDDFLQNIKKTEDQLKQEYLKEAEKRVRVRLVIARAIKMEEISVSDEEIEAEIEKRVSDEQSSEGKEKMRNKFQNENNLKNRLVNAMMLDKLFAKYLFTSV